MTRKETRQSLHHAYRSTWNNAGKKKGKGNNTAARRKQSQTQPAKILVWDPSKGKNGGYKWTKEELAA